MPVYSKLKSSLQILSFTAFLIAAYPVFAQETPPQATAKGVYILPAKAVKDTALLAENNEDTHPPLKITPDKSELIRLNQKAGSIIVGNPDHLNVLADSAKTIVLVPKLPGATYITILNTSGEVIMQRHVIIGTAKERYIRIRKTCAGQDESCQPTQVYFCPDACHEVNVASEISEANDSPFDALEAIVEDAQSNEDEQTARQEENPTP